MPGSNEVHRSQKVAAEISGHSDRNVLISIEKKNHTEMKILYACT